MAEGRRPRPGLRYVLVSLIIALVWWGCRPAELFVGDINLGFQAFRPVVVEGRGRAFVLGPGVAAALDIDSGRVLATAGAGGQPGAAVAAPAAGRVFVLDVQAPGGVYVFDVGSGRRLSETPLEAWVRPRAAAVDEQNGRLVVTSWGWPAFPGGGRATVFDLRSGTVLGQVEVGFGPAAVATDPDRGLGFVANAVSNSLSVIDIRRPAVVATVTLGPQPGTAFRVGFNPASGRVFVLSYPPKVSGGPNEGRIDVVSAKTFEILDRVTLPNPVAMTVGSGRVYVVGAEEDRSLIFGLDAWTGQKLWSAQVEGAPATDVAIDPTRPVSVDALGLLGERVLVATATGALYVLDAGSGRVRCRILLGSKPGGLAADRVGGRAVVALPDGERVKVLRPEC
jgi:YVTN family beta-propeller protein